MFDLCKPTKKRDWKCAAKLGHILCPFLSEHDGKLKCDFALRYPEELRLCPFGGFDGHPLQASTRYPRPRPQIRDYICLDSIVGRCSREKRIQVATRMVYCARGMHVKSDKVWHQTELDMIEVNANLTMCKALLTFRCPHPEPCTEGNRCQFGHEQKNSTSVKLHPLASLLCDHFLSGECPTIEVYHQSAQDPTSGVLLGLQRCLNGLHPTTDELNDPKLYLQNVRLIIQANAPTDCAICLESISGFSLLNEEIQHQECCRHYFHSICYVEWRKHRRHVTCPTCRMDSFRSILWPRLFVSEAEKQLVFTLQKECFGLVDVPPESRVAIKPQHRNSATPSQRIRVVFDDSIRLSRIFPVQDGPAGPPQWQYELPEPDPAPYQVYFHPENCAHYLPLQSYWTHYRSKMRRSGTLTCPTCGVCSRFVLLWPMGMFGIEGEKEQMDIILDVQKILFQVHLPSHDPSVLIKQHQDGQFAVTINEVEQTVRVINGQLIE